MKRTSSAQLQDPDPFSLIALIVAGATLVLGLEQKIEARKAAETQQKDKEAERACALALTNLEKNLSEIEQFATYLRKVGDFQQVPGRKPGFGSHRLFIPGSEVNEFSVRFRNALVAIDHLSHEVMTIPLDDLSLREADRQMLLGQLAKIRESANSVLDKRDPFYGFVALEQISVDARIFTQALSVLIGREIKGPDGPSI